MKRYLILAALVVSLTGCCTDLQESYVSAMESTYSAVQADVKAGLYKPDAASTKTLDGWLKANTDARKALKANDKAAK